MSVIHLSKIDTRAPENVDKAKTKDDLQGILAELNGLQNVLYAESKHAVLIVIQGMDASGKDGLIRHVFGNVNPQGVMVQSFKIPTPEELAHDFLWRIHKHTPAKGMIQIFNRSYYEDILITRVHKLINDSTAKQRMQAINNFEEMLAENGTVILKFYLHISQEEQQKRLKDRMADKTKFWKYNANDFKEAELWNKYMHAYEDCIMHCNKTPWTIVPSDQNWYKEFVAADLLCKTLKGLHMKYPQLKI